MRNFYVFERLADVVIRRGWIVVLFWVAATAALVQFAPSWESVSRDDDVHFFPAEYPSVIGQDLLDRGFPHDASSSQAVVVAERRDGPLTAADRDYVAGLVAALNTAPRGPPEAGDQAGRLVQDAGHRPPAAQPGHRRGAGGPDGRLAQRHLPGEVDPDRRRRAREDLQELPSPRPA